MMLEISHIADVFWVLDGPYALARFTYRADAELFVLAKEGKQPCSQCGWHESLQDAVFTPPQLPPGFYMSALGDPCQFSYVADPPVEEDADPEPDIVIGE